MTLACFNRVADLAILSSLQSNNNWNLENISRMLECFYKHLNLLGLDAVTRGTQAVIQG